MADTTQIGIELVAEGFDTVETTLRSLEEISNDMRFSLKILADVMDNFAVKQLNAMKEQSQLLSSVLKQDTEPALDDLKDEINNVAQSATKTANTINQKTDPAMNDLGNSTDQVTQESKQLESQTDQTTESVDQFGKESATTAQKTDTFKVSLTDIVNAAANVASAVVDVTRFLVDIGQKAFEAGKEVVGIAADFQSSMSILSIAASSSGQTFEELSDAALAVGGDTRLVGVSASGAAEAMTNLYKAGLDTNLIFGDLNGYMNEGADLGGALKASIDLAAASELDMGQAAELAAVLMATFGSEMETAEDKAQFINDAMNNMVQAADASVAEVAGLAEALKMVGPAAGAAGFDIFEVNNALAVLSTRGIQGSMAGTSLNSMISSLRDLTPGAQDAINSLGIELRDVNGDMLPLVDIVAQFEVALEGVSTAEKDAALGAIFTAQGLRAMDTLVSEGVEGWTEMSAATSSAATIYDQAAAKAATFSGQMEAMEGVLETFKIMIGNAILPIAGDFVGFLTGVAEEYGPMVISVVEGLSGTFRSFANYILGVFKSGETVNDWLGDFPKEMEPVIMAIGNVVAWIRDAIPNAIEFLSTLWTDTLVPMFAEMLPKALNFLINIWSNILYPALVNTWNFIQSSLIPVLQVIWSWFTQYLSIAIEAFVTYWNQNLVPTFMALQEEWQNLQPALAELWAWLQERVPQAIETLNQFWQGVLLPALAIVWTFIRETLIPVFFDVVEWLMTNIPVAIDTAVKFWNETLYPALELVWKFIQENVIPIIAKVAEWLEVNVPLAIEEARRVWVEVLKPALNEVWLFIQENVIPIIEKVVEWLQVNIPLAIEEARRVWVEVLKPALDEVWAFIDEYLYPLFTELLNLLDVTLKKAIETLAVIWTETLKPALDEVWKFISENVIPIIDDLIKKVSEGLQPVFENFDKFLREKLSVGLQDVKDFISGLTTKIGELAAKIAGFDPSNLKDYTADSPAPLALGLSQVRKQMGAFTSMELPRFSAEIAAVGMASPGPAMSAGSVMTTNVNNTFNTTVQDGVGQRAFENRVMNTVNRSLATGAA